MQNWSSLWPCGLQRRVREALQRAREHARAVRAHGLRPRLGGPQVERVRVPHLPRELAVSCMAFLSASLLARPSFLALPFSAPASN